MGARASRQNAKISSPAALSGQRFINTADTGKQCTEARQTSREITRGAWPFDLREREKDLPILISQLVDSPDASARVNFADFIRECALPSRHVLFRWCYVLIVPLRVPPSASSNSRIARAKGRCTQSDKFAWTTPCWVCSRFRESSMLLT